MPAPLTLHFHRISAEPYPEPIEAARAAPPYLHALPRDPFLTDGRPMQRAAELGFVLPLIANTHFACDASGTLLAHTDAEAPITTQYPEQIRGAPFEGRAIPKFPNPWTISTPAGWSSLFIPPLNRLDSPMEILAGLIETDTYYREVLFPSLSTLHPGQSFTMAQGTPLVQVIPIERQRWRAVIHSRERTSGAFETPNTDDRIIQFTTGTANASPPISASRAVPEWLKRMPAEVSVAQTGRPDQTVKKCAPFVEAVTAGYLLTLPHDLELSLDAPRKLGFRSTGDLIDATISSAYPQTPFERAPVIHLKLPWRIQTPAGYSTLILPTLNRFDTPLRALAGLLDTDAQSKELRIPAICLMNPGMSASLPRGTPIAQLIPIQRRSWSHQIGLVEPQRRLEIDRQFSENPHFYKDALWTRKSYD